MTIRPRWKPLDLNDISQKSGVYGFKSGDRWLYIGKANNLRKRLNKYHVPLQITLECFANAKFYCIFSDSPLRLEKQLHQQLKPEWNGGTGIENKYPSCNISIKYDLTDEVMYKQMYSAISALTIEGLEDD